MKSNSFADNARFDPFLSRLLNQMHPSVVESFTDAQLSALRNAMVRPNRHKVDIRLSIPIPFKRFYLVILAGPERRSRSRRMNDGFRLWTPVNIAFLSLLLLSICMTIWNISHLLGSLNYHATNNFNATALPWIKSEQDCVGKHRQWRDGLCFDSEHSPEF